MTTYSGAKGRRALVVGLGISGMATAIRLRKAGWEPVIVERAPARRTGGYFIALFDPGRRAAERLGILGDMHDRYPPDCVGWIEDRAGNRKPGLVFPPGIRPYMLLRTDVERAAFENLPPDVEIRYSTTPIHIAQDDTGVEVTLDQNGAAVTERFDLVVGADGLRSTVRRLVFGPHEQCLHRLGYMITAFTLPAPIGGYAGNEIVSLFEPDRSLWLIPFKDHPPAVLFSYRTDDVDAQFRGRPVDRIREAYGPEPPGRLLGEAIAALEAADHYSSTRSSRSGSTTCTAAAWCWSGTPPGARASTPAWAPRPAWSGPSCSAPCSSTTVTTWPRRWPPGRTTCGRSSPGSRGWACSGGSSSPRAAGCRSRCGRWRPAPSSSRSSAPRSTG